MKVLFVSSGLGTGGAERSLLRLCTALVARGLQPAVICLSRETTLLPQFAQARVETLVHDFGRPLAWWESWSRARRWLMQWQPDIVQGWMYHGNLIATLLAARAEARHALVWSVRQTLDGTRDPAQTRAVIRLNQWFSARAAAIVYNSEQGRRDHEAMGYHQSAGTVIHNGVEPRPVVPLDRSTARALIGVPQLAFAVGHVARFHPSKDHHGFLSGFADLVHRLPDAIAVMAGTGVDSSNATLQGWIDELGLGPNTRLLGNRPDIDRIFPALDILCMSSSGMEGFPNVVAEAMASAVPCVVTRVGDAADIVGDAGVVVAPADRAALAAGLLELAQLDSVRRSDLVARAHERVQRLFSVDRMADEFVALYRRVLS